MNIHHLQRYTYTWIKWLYINITCVWYTRLLSRTKFSPSRSVSFYNQIFGRHQHQSFFMLTVSFNFNSNDSFSHFDLLRTCLSCLTELFLEHLLFHDQSIDMLLQFRVGLLQYFQLSQSVIMLSLTYTKQLLHLAATWCTHKQTTFKHSCCLQITAMQKNQIAFSLIFPSQKKKKSIVWIPWHLSALLPGELI